MGRGRGLEYLTTMVHGYLLEKQVGELRVRERVCVRDRERGREGESSRAGGGG